MTVLFKFDARNTPEQKNLQSHEGLRPTIYLSGFFFDSLLANTIIRKMFGLLSTM